MVDILTSLLVARIFFSRNFPPRTASARERREKKIFKWLNDLIFRLLELISSWWNINWELSKFTNTKQPHGYKTFWCSLQDLGQKVLKREREIEGKGERKHCERFINIFINLIKRTRNLCCACCCACCWKNDKEHTLMANKIEPKIK